MRKFIYLFIFLLFNCNNNHIKKLVKQASFKGKIVKIYKDSWDHGLTTISINYNEKIFEINDPIEMEIYEYAKLGDSIIKPADTLVIYIKKNDAEIKSFKYLY